MLFARATVAQVAVTRVTDALVTVARVTVVLVTVARVTVAWVTVIWEGSDARLTDALVLGVWVRSAQYIFFLQVHHGMTIRRLG